MENELIPKADVQAQVELLQSHLKRLREILPQNNVYLIAEANMSWVQASHFAHLCAPFQIHPIRDEKTKNVGIITTQESKENGVLLAQAAITNSQITRAKDKAFSIGKTAWHGDDGKSYEERFKERVGELVTQMSKFRKQFKMPADAFQKSKMTFSGKSGVDQDDLIMTFIIMTYWVQKAINMGI